MILNYFVSLLGEFLLFEFLQGWFFPMIALAFLVCIPSFFRYLFRKGGS